MKTIRLLYPDHLGGGLDTYYFGANLLAHILPSNAQQHTYEINITPPSKTEYNIIDGIYAKEQICDGIKQANELLKQVKPDKIITIGGSCIVSQASFDYLHGVYDNLGIIWIDAHPDVSKPDGNYAKAHAMVLSSLLGQGSDELTKLLENEKFEPNNVLYVGLQKLHNYQMEFLQNMGMHYTIQTNDFITTAEISDFIKKFDHVLVHLDIDVLDPSCFHSTYFANKQLIGDGSGAGKMTIEQLSVILNHISQNSDIVGFTIAEYLPFNEHDLNKILSQIKIFNDK